MTTRELLSESLASAQARERSTFDQLAAAAKRGVVLFGAGRLGRKTAACLRGRPKPLAFADNDLRLHGTVVEGIPVVAPAVAAGKWGDDSLFVVTTSLPTCGGVQARMGELLSLGCGHVTSYLQVGWRHDGILPHFGADLPSRLLTHAKELALVEALWWDDRSRETFRQELAWRLRASTEGRAPPVTSQYFPRDILHPNPNEVFVDGGAFDGDTLRSAPWSLGKVLAIEPDPANAAILRASCNRSTRVFEVLLGRAPGLSRFDGRGTMASCRSENGALERPVATLDEITTGEIPTFVKLDVEGDELAALQGGAEMLVRTQPVVAVCLYHRPEDLWTIPLFLHKTLPRHRLYLVSHAWDGFELVAYAIPPERGLSDDRSRS